MKHQGAHLCILLTLLLIPLASSADSEYTEFGQCCKKDIALRPNESVNCFMKDRTVKVTWIWKGERSVTRRERGYLLFDVADGKIASQTVAISSQTSDYKYLFDEVFFTVDGEGRDHCEFLNISYYYQPRQQRFGPEPQKEVEIAVSSIEPVTLNEWKLELSGFAGGSTQSVLLAKNINNNTTKSIPVLRGTVERIGRFQLHIIDIVEETRLVRLLVSADPDLTIQGGDTYVPDGISISPNETLGAFLDRMSKQYSFEVEWVEYPGHPESVEYLKGFKLSGSPGKIDGILASVIENSISGNMWSPVNGGDNIHGDENFIQTWLDPRYLRIEYKNYEKILAEAEERQHREDEIAKAKEEWERDYKPELCIYSLKKVTPVTAKSFVDPCLSGFVYYLSAIKQYGNPDDITATDRIKSGAGNWIVERCVADDKANAVIVTAIPATHKKIEELLASMEGMINEESAKGPIKQYRLEVTLLRGVQQLPTPTPAADAPKPQAAQVVQNATGSMGEEKANIIEKSFTLHNARPSKVLEQVRQYKSNTPHADAIAVDDQNMIIVRDIPEALARIEDLLGELDAIKGLDVPISDVSFLEQRPTEVADLLSTLGGININVAGDLSPKIRITYALKTQKTIRQVLDDLGDLYHLSIDYRPDGVFIRGKDEAVSKPSPLVNLTDLGISQQDLELLGPNTGAEILGRGAINLIGQAGEEGKSLVALTPGYTFEIQYLDTREPYMIIKGTLLGNSSVQNAEELVKAGLAPQSAVDDAAKEPGKPLLQNTLYLEAGKPSLLGLTNLREALILLVKWREE